MTPVATLPAATRARITLRRELTGRSLCAGADRQLTDYPGLGSNPLDGRISPSSEQGGRPMKLVKWPVPRRIEGKPVVRRGRKATVRLGASRAAAGVSALTPDWQQARGPGS